MSHLILIQCPIMVELAVTQPVELPMLKAENKWEINKP